MKKLLLVLAGLLVVIGSIVTLKATQIASLLGFVQEMEEAGMPPVPVATFGAREEEWEQVLDFPGSLRAVEGVNLTAEVGGVVMRIAVANGAEVEKGEILIELDVAKEKAELAAEEARLRLAELNLDRAKGLLERRTISHSEFDSESANYDVALATVENLRSVIAKKIIKAPFSGTTGIREVNVGQTVAPGDPLIPLFNDDPIFVEFAVPQSQLAQLRKAREVRIRMPSIEGIAGSGEITAVNPALDETTRSMRVQATLANPEGLLLPGEFVQVEVLLPDREPVLCIPVSSVLTAAYGDSVFVIEENEGTTTAVQKFVRLGKTKGDFVAVKEGLAPGERVVSAGAFKLSTGAAVVIDDDMQPTPEIAPDPDNA